MKRNEVLYGLKNYRTGLLRCLWFLLISLAIVYVITSGINKPIVSLTKECHQMAKGDFSKSINKKHLARKDELGILAQTFNMMGDNLRKLLKENNRISNEVFSSTSNINRKIQQSMQTLKKYRRRLKR